MEGGTDVVVNGNPLPQRNGAQQLNTSNIDIKKPINLARPQNRGLGGRGNGGGNRFVGRGNMGGRQNNNMNRNNQGQSKQSDNEGNGNSKNDDNRRGGGGRKNESYSQEFVIAQKIKCLNGPTHELPCIEAEEIKFSGRNRLYIGNLTNDVSEEELTELFKPYGEISESFINKEKNFAFLKVDFHVNAERAKRELDGSMRKNRPIRIRFAPNATTIRVKNLTPYVTNELLFKAFEVFGPVERAVIIVDDRGKTTGEGIVEYARKSGAMTALRYSSEKCFFLTSSLRPCVLEPFEHIDDTDGYSEKSLNKKNPDFFKNRQTGPRFAEVGSFEHEYGTRWKQLHELYKQKHASLKREMQMEEEKLEAQMEFAKYEHDTELLREQLRSREQDRDRQKIEWEIKERQAEEQRTREDELMRRQEEEMQLRMHRQEEELRRRQQENTLFMQAQQLSSLLDQQEINQGGRNNNRNDSGDRRGNNVGGGNNNYDNMMNQGGGGGGMGNNQDTGYMDYEHGQNNRPSRFDEQGNQNQGGGQGGNIGGNGSGGGPRGGGNRNHWNDRRGGDDFQNKRRRF